VKADITAEDLMQRLHTTATLDAWNRIG